MKQPTKLQQWARQRNWNKRRIGGIMAHLQAMIDGTSSSTITIYERTMLRGQLYSMEILLSHWKEQSNLSKRGISPTRNQRRDEGCTAEVVE